MNLDDLKKTKVGQLPANAHVFSPARAVADSKRQQDQRSESKDRVMEAMPSGLGYRITIVSMRRKLVDGHDNLRTGAKPLVDNITAWLGFKSDDDPRLDWQYHQLKTSAVPGTTIQIDPIYAPR